MTPESPQGRATLRKLTGKPRSRAAARVAERAITTALVLCATFSILVTGMIVFVLFSQTIGFFKVHGDDTPGRVNAACGTEPETRRASALEISEMRIHSATDRQVEYVEIAGPPGASLAGVSYVVLGGRSGEGEDEKEVAPRPGRVSAVVACSGSSLDASGFYVIGNQKRVFRSRTDQVADGDKDGALFPDGGNQTHLLVRGFTGAVGEDLDADGDGAFDRMAWGEVLDSLALVAAEPGEGQPELAVYADEHVGPTYGHTPSHVYRCRESGKWYSSTTESIAVSPVEFLTGTQWNPLLGAVKHYGVLPLLGGTVLVAVIAMGITVPFGLISAIYLSEYAPRRVRAVLKPLLEVLGGIPTVVYGYFALMVITPILKAVHGPFASLFSGWLPDPEKLVETYTKSEQFAVWITKPFESYNVMSAGLAVGVMTLPIVCSLSEDALQAVPRSLREGAYGIGSTKFEVSTKVVLPAALSGIVAAFLLAIARAFGETMIVALAAGNLAQLTLDPRESTQTMTAWIVQIFLGDASNFGPEYLSCYAVAATLFLMTLCLTLLGGWVLKRYREVYQ